MPIRKKLKSRLKAALFVKKKKGILANIIPKGNRIKKGWKVDMRFGG